MLLILSVLFTKTFSFHGIYKYSLFLQNFNNQPPVFFQEAWSLSVEEWFYLLIPLSLFLQIRILNISANKAVLMTIFSIIIFSIFYRFYRYSNISTPINCNHWSLLFRMQVMTRLDSLMLGVLGAYSSYYHKLFFSKNKLISFLTGILILFAHAVCDLLHLFGFGLYQCVFSFTVIGIGGLLLLPFLSELKTGSGTVYKIITHISIISYSMYLLNYTVIQCFLLKYVDCHFMARFLPLPPPLIKYLLYWFLTIIGAHILYKYVEKPFIDLRRAVKLVKTF